MFSALIIDADQDATTNIEAALGGYGFEFTSTQDAPEAMTMARSSTPDIIFLRVELPNVSGFSVCNKLRRSDETKYIPLVMYASGVSDDVFNQHRNLKTHADEYLKLPFAGATLVDAVKTLIPIEESDGGDAPIVDTPVAAEASDTALDVDLDDLDDDLSVEIEAGDAAAVAEEPSGLDMPEFDEEFAEMNSDDEPTEQPTNEGEDLGAETDAAFDALMGGGEPEPEPEPAVEVAPEPEPEPAVEVAPEPEPEPEPVGLTSESDDEAPTEFKAQREVIHLKSQLNAKNREILALKDEGESQERAVLDAKHKNRELLSQLGDLEEKLLTLEDEKLTAQEQAKAAVRDKNTILKREDGLKTRFEHAQKKIKDVEEQLASSAAAQEEAEAARASGATQLDAVRNELESSQAAAAQLGEQLAEAQGRISEVEAELQTAEEQARAMNETVTRLEGELDDAKTQLETAKEQAATELAAQLEEAQQAASKEVATAIAAQAAEHQAEVEFNEGQHRSAMAQVKSDADETERAARAEVEKLRASITEAEEAAQTERDRLLKDISDEQARGAEEVTAMQGKQDQLQSELERVSGELDDVRSDLARVSNQLETRDRELGGRLDAERRAQQALAVALRVLDGQPRS